MIGHTISMRVGVLLTAAVSLVTCSSPPPEVTPATPRQIKQRVEESRAPLTLVHVWATWCDPCREEFPDVMKAQRRYKDRGVRLILVSADDPDETESIRGFLAEHESPVGTLVATELSEEFIETLSPKWSGALPASFFFANGRLVKEWEGVRSFDQYAKTIESLLKKSDVKSSLKSMQR